MLVFVTPILSCKSSFKLHIEHYTKNWSVFHSVKILRKITDSNQKLDLANVDVHTYVIWADAIN